jgi:2-methylcitrate dehydratase
LISSLWAACELSQRSDQGKRLLRAMVLAYDVMCRLCDAASLRTRGWDHVSYLPVASAVGCSFILSLTPEQTGHAIALAVIGHNAMRQTRVGTISDWKAACAAHGAQAGLNAALLARNGFTGPTDVFSGRHGFFAQVSGPFSLSSKNPSKPWRIFDTHTKFFPAEHHAQSAIEAALVLHRHPGMLLAGIASVNGKILLGSSDSGLRRAGMTVKNVIVDIFEVGAAIIGSEKEKWHPTTRETADHSLPYLVCIALLDGDVTLDQYRGRRYLDPDIRKIMKLIKVRHHKPYDRLYPQQMPTRVTIKLSSGQTLSSEIARPKGYAGRPMGWDEVVEKFHRLATPLSQRQRARLVQRVKELDQVQRLASFQTLLRVRR